jgi:predicted transcriptional regulator
MPRYKITFFHPDDYEPDTRIVNTSTIEKSFAELQNANPEVEFISYEELKSAELKSMDHKGFNVGYEDSVTK